jgi:hypothetical protein
LERLTDFDTEIAPFLLAVAQECAKFGGIGMLKKKNQKLLVELQARRILAKQLQIIKFVFDKSCSFYLLL